MANNYLETSSWLDIPRDKHEQANKIIERVEKELEEDEESGGYCGIQANLEVDDHRCGVWFSHDESGNVEHLAEIARALVEELEIDKPFYCSWAYTCSKPRIDEFGGGAFVIVRGKETYWCDAMHHVMEQVEHGGLQDLECEDDK